MKLVVLSRVQAEKYQIRDTVKHAIISIRGPWQAESQLRPLPGLLGVLRLVYDDVEYQRPNYVLMSPEQADQVVAFADEMREKGAKIMICHCEAGICRSAATAAALCRLYDIDDDVFWERPFLPNMLVYKRVIGAILRGVLRRRFMQPAWARKIPLGTGAAS